MRRPLLLLLTAFSCAAAAGNCPNAREWRALKARTFFNKQFAAAFSCYAVIPGIENRNNDVRHKLTVTYREYYEEQMAIASSFYDRTGRGGGARAGGYNAQWDRDETSNLNRYSLEGSNQNANEDQHHYCLQASESLDRILAAGSAAQIESVAVNHPYASEHNLNDCRNH